MTERTSSDERRPAGPCVLVIFGAAGDLTQRLLFPALYNLADEGLLPEAFAVVGFARTDVSEDDLRDRLRDSVKGSSENQVKPELVEWLASRLFYVQAGFDDRDGYGRLVRKLEEIDRERGTGGNYLFYLATAPEFFLEVTRQLGDCGMAAEDHGHWRRVVIEKPFGTDIASARELNAQLTRVVREKQIYRIDHYLGKETVQNILVLRFANSIFEPIWNRRYIDHVQITVAEKVGVETRGGYYDHTGALRDMVPNHLLQLLTLTAMEPPSSFSPSALHDEQAKVLASMPPLDPADCALCAIRAQYAAGGDDGGPHPGYTSEARVSRDSRTETYVALRLAVDNWRWAGVPFYLRTGKRLRRRRTEVVIQFRKAPLAFFRQASVKLPGADRLIVHIQPEESISLEFAAKVPGPAVVIQPVAMRFCYQDYFGVENRTGYETLLYDAMIGDSSLFKRADIVEAGWVVVDPILKAWKREAGDLFAYEAGSDGPGAANEMMRRDGREWRSLD